MSEQLVFDHYPLSKEPLVTGWTVASIGEISRLVASGFPSGQHNQEKRGVPHIRPMNVDREGRLDLNILKYVDGAIPRELSKGDILFNNTNSPELIGKTAVVSIDKRLAYSNHMTRICLEAGFDPAFIAYHLHYLWMSGYFRHRCVNHVNQASISADPLSQTVPILIAPSPEQSRIAAVLDELFSDLDAGVTALERARDKLKLYRASVLKAAVEGALTAEWCEEHSEVEPASELLKRILADRRCLWEQDQLRKFEEKGKTPPKNWKAKYKEPVAPDNANLPPSLEGWCWATVDQCVTLIQYGSSAKASRSPDGVPILRMGNVSTDGRLIFDDLKYLPADHDEFPDLLLEKGDLLFNRTNSAELVGKTAAYSGEPSPCSFASYLIRVRLLEGVRPAILVFALNSGFGRAWIKRMVNQTVGQANVNGTKLATFVFPLPPANEQEAIAETVEERLSVIEHLEAEIAAKLQSAQRLRQSILRHAFTGQLVPQDPNDEPASELLKRIAVEREARAREAAVAKRAARKAGSRNVSRGRHSALSKQTIKQ